MHNIFILHTTFLKLYQILIQTKMLATYCKLAKELKQKEKQ